MCSAGLDGPPEQEGHWETLKTAGALIRALVAEGRLIMAGTRIGVGHRETVQHFGYIRRAAWQEF